MYNPSISVGEMKVAEMVTSGTARACEHVIWDKCAKNEKELLPTFLSGNEFTVGNTTIDMMGYKANTAQGRTSGVLRLARRQVFEDGFRWHLARAIMKFRLKQTTSSGQDLTLTQS